MNAPQPSDKTPTQGHTILMPTGIIKTQQATFVAILCASFVCGGFLVSIKRDVADLSDKYRNLQGWVYEAVKTMNPNTAKSLPPPDLFTVPKGP